jgi:GT2 family glycosyltransferase
VSQSTWCICFIHYGDPGLTARAVDSARELHPTTPILVIDDCAPRAYHPTVDQVTVVQTPTNSGYGAAVNVAFEWAMTRKMRCIFIANNDVQLLEPLSPLLPFVKQVAAVAPVVVDTWTGGRESWRVQNAGSLVDPRTGYSITLGRGTELGQCSPTTKVDYLCGAAAIYNLAVVDEIGGFRHDYFLFWEDAEWCHRAAVAGHALRVDPSVVVAHQGTATIARYTQVNMYYRIRNEAWFALQIRGRRARMLYRVRFLLVSAPHRMASAARRVGLRGAFWVFKGAMDGLRNPRKVTGGPRPT